MPSHVHTVEVGHDENRASRFSFVLAACTTAPPTEDPSDGTWVGTITTEGNVTTVANESGSLWGGAATLVEELSIGVDEGEPYYMLGPSRGVWDSGDRIIYADMSVPAVRVYDGAGNYLGDVGRSGQGPGEYQFPFSGATLSDGRILVTNAESGWVDIFDPDLSYSGRWGPHPDDLTAPVRSRLNHALVVGTNETLYLDYWEWPENQDLRQGWRAIDTDELGPVIWDPPLEFEVLRNCLRQDCSRYLSVQYSPGVRDALLPSGEMVAGISNDYSFAIYHADGSTTSIRRHWNPVELSDEEWDYWTRRQRAQGLAGFPDWQARWSPDVPREKPAFTRFAGTRDGRILVHRDGPSRRLEDCTEDPLSDYDVSTFVPCWVSSQRLDVFHADGRYLGEIKAPSERLRSSPHVDGSRFTAVVEDATGTIKVKRYRLVLPGEEAQ